MKKCLIAVLLCGSFTGLCAALSLESISNGTYSFALVPTGDCVRVQVKELMNGKALTSTDFACYPTNFIQTKQVRTNYTNQRTWWIRSQASQPDVHELAGYAFISEQTLRRTRICTGCGTSISNQAAWNVTRCLDEWDAPTGTWTKGAPSDRLSSASWKTMQAHLLRVQAALGTHNWTLALQEVDQLMRERKEMRVSAPVLLLKAFILRHLGAEGARCLKLLRLACAEDPFSIVARVERQILEEDGNQMGDVFDPVPQVRTVELEEARQWYRLWNGEKELDMLRPL